MTATELKQNFGKYLAFVEEFNEVVITRNGNKVARLTPYVTDFEQYLAVRERALDYQYDGKKVSYEEFMQIYEKSELRMEFIDGEIYVLGSPSITHQEILGKLYLIFHNYFDAQKQCKVGQCRVFLAPFDVHFRKRGIQEPDVCQPDLLVICDLEGNVNDRDCYMGTPTLVVEILSKSTRAKDMIKNDEIAMVINTVEERRNAIADSRAIRTSSLLARVTTFTTIFGAEAAVEGMKYLDQLDVYSVQELHAQLA